jgi:lysine-specific permease
MNKNTEMEPSSDLKRGMDVRHLNMIAIGGSIGTGLFLATGNSIHLAGPGGTMLAYLIVSVMVYFLMTSLGEMAAYIPSSGSFYTYAAEYVDPALGVALGFNYWYNWAITVASEVCAASLIMGFWFPHTPPFVWNLLAFCIFVSLNFLPSRGFGETEYWFSLIKVLAIIVFILLGGALIFGFMGNNPIGFKYWTIGDAPFHGGKLAIFNALIMAGFSFQGTELIGVAAGESKEPGKSIPSAVKKVFWRIVLFYIISVLIVSFLIPYTSDLLNNSDVRSSPFTMVFHQAGIPFAASLINLVIIVGILSAGNSGMYASTRMLWFLAKKKHLPEIFARVSKRGVPVYALIATAAVSLIAFSASIFGSGVVYFWLVSASSVSGFITWAGIATSHYYFRKAYLKQGSDLKNLPYVAKGYPYAPLIALAFCFIVIIGQNYSVFMDGSINYYGLIVSYMGVPIFLAIWLGYKWVKKTSFSNFKQNDFIEIVKC